MKKKNSTDLKLTDLKLTESFIQLNLIKGFKFIDKAGEIVNNYHDENNNINFKMGLDGLELFQINNKVDVIKYSSQVFWLKMKIDLIDQIEHCLKEPLEVLENIQEVKQTNRIGIRNRFLIEINKEDLEKFQNKLNNTICNEITSFTILNSVKKINSNITFEIVVNKNDSKKKAIKIDVDTYISELNEINKTNQIVKNMIKYYKNEFMDLINQILEVD